jgi:proline iminopeptidase
MRIRVRTIAPGPILTAGVVLSALAAEPESGVTFQAGDVTLWYEVRGAGEGTPLVLVNGGPGFDHSYLHTAAWDRMARDRRVVFYDQRGNGNSSPLKEGQPCGLAEQIADLEALRTQLGDDAVDLLGHSWGGYLAMAYAALHPQRVAHLVIVDSAAPKIQDTAFLFKQIYPETTAREDALAFAVELGDQSAVAADLREYMSMLFYSHQNRDAFLARASRFKYSQVVNRAVWTDLQRFDLNPELGKFRFPTLVVTGRYDFNVAPAVAWAIHHAIPGSEFAVFEKSGHFPFIDEEDAFLSRLMEFLARPGRPLPDPAAR